MKNQIICWSFKMKLRFLFIAVLALFISGCMDTIMAVPAAAVSGVGNVVGGIWGAVTSIF
jgi:hypothetical protein